MGKAIRLEKNGRQLEVRAAVTAGDWHIWIVENGARIYLYEVVPFDAADNATLIDGVLRRAKNEIETDSIVIPVT